MKISWLGLIAICNNNNYDIILMQKFNVYHKVNLINPISREYTELVNDICLLYIYKEEEVLFADIQSLIATCLQPSRCNRPDVADVCCMNNNN